MSTPHDDAFLMTPGPTEVPPEVMQAISIKPISFAHAPFFEIFGQALEKTRKIFMAGPKSQPLILSGSGILGWEMVAVNLLEPGDHVICCVTGNFGTRFVQTLEVFGHPVTTLSGALGANPTSQQVEEALKKGGDKVKAITFTHVETSTAVASQVKEMAALVRRVAPNVLILVDAVAATGAEELRMEEWGIDYVMTGSQKALGVPPGLSIAIASERAVGVYKNRKAKHPSYFANWDNWIPIMNQMEARKPAYFGTPSVNLIRGLNKAYDLLLQTGMETVWERHVRVQQAVVAALKAIGLSIVAEANQAAHSLTCVYLPEGIAPPTFLQKCEAKKVIFAPAIHPATKEKAFRFGHMGVSAWDWNRQDVVASVTAIQEVLHDMGYNKYEPGIAAKVYKETLGKKPSNL